MNLEELPNTPIKQDEKNFRVDDNNDNDEERRYVEDREVLRENTMFLRQESLELTEEVHGGNRERDDFYRGDCGGELTRFLSSPIGMIVGFIGFLLALPFIVLGAILYALAVSTSYAFGTTSKFIKRCKKNGSVDNNNWYNNTTSDTPISKVKKIEDIDIDDLVEDLTCANVYRTPFFYNKKDIYLLKFIRTNLEQHLYASDKNGLFQCLKWYVVMVNTTSINAGECKSVYNLLFKLSILEGEIESRNEFWFNVVLTILGLVIGLPEWLSYFEVQLF